ncbi:MAG: extracellular solute-binding protein [Anaerolineales bacterium]|jgi:raffinose/stachyose/melibiose transport system substrate-binding protein
MESRTFRLVTILIIASFTLLFVAGCGGGETPTPPVEETTVTETEPVSEMEEVVLDMWHWAANKEPIYQVAIAEYKELHPNVSIQTNVIPTDAWQQTLTAALVGGEAPEILTGVIMGMVLEQWDNDQIVDLTPYIDEEWEAALYPAAWDALTIDGRILSVSFASNNIQCFYNKTRFEELGIETPIETMDELQEATQVLREAGFGGGLYWASEKQLTHQFFLNAARQMYPEEFDAADRGDGRWDIPEFIEIMEQVHSYSDIWEEGVVSMSLDEAVNSFASGKASFYFIGNWAINSIVANEPDFEIATFPVPALNDQTKPSALYSLAGTWMISNQHPQDIQEIGIDFLRFFALNYQDELMRQIGLCPSGPAGENAFPDAHPLAQELCDDSDKLVARDMFDRIIRDELAIATQGMLTGALTPEEVLQTVQEAKESK